MTVLSIFQSMVTITLIMQVLRDSCSKRILVTEFIDGVKISDTKMLKDQGYDVSTIGQRLIKIFAEQVV